MEWVWFFIKVVVVLCLIDFIIVVALIVSANKKDQMPGIKDVQGKGPCSKEKF